MSNVERIEDELAGLEGYPPGLAQGALTMAAGLDDSHASLAMKALAMRELRETMDRIREIAPPKRQGDFVDRLRDDIAAQREKRARRPKTKAVESS